MDVESGWRLHCVLWVLELVTCTPTVGVQGEGATIGELPTERPPAPDKNKTNARLSVDIRSEFHTIPALDIITKYRSNTYFDFKAALKIKDS